MVRRGAPCCCLAGERDCPIDIALFEQSNYGMVARKDGMNTGVDWAESKSLEITS